MGIIAITALGDVKELARVFKALSDETRLSLVLLLAERGTEGALCVGTLVKRLGVTQAAVSKHLAVLRAAGLVIDERRGRYVLYRVNRRRLAEWQERMMGFLVEERTEAVSN